MTIGIVTMPFICEGEKSILRALEFADKLSQHTDSIITISNKCRIVCEFLNPDKF